MEFIVVESSKESCVTHIKQHIQQDMSNEKKTDMTCTLQVMKLYNHYYPIIYELFPKVLIDIIIEYVHDIFDVVISLMPTIYNHVYSIRFNNMLLSINHTYFIKIINSHVRMTYRLFSLEYDNLLSEITTYELTNDELIIVIRVLYASLHNYGVIK